MVVRDVTDFCFHSYFSFMDELSENMRDDETPFDIKYVISHAVITRLCFTTNFRTLYVSQIYSCFQEKLENWINISTNTFCFSSANGRLSYLPRSLLVMLVAVPLDVLMITGVALWKSPCMLLKGWQRLCEDLVGREGPFLETVCVPFAGLAIVLWPLAVIGGVIASFLSSFFLGLHSGLIAYQVIYF